MFSQLTFRYIANDAYDMGNILSLQSTLEETTTYYRKLDNCSAERIL